MISDIQRIGKRTRENNYASRQHHPYENHYRETRIENSFWISTWFGCKAEIRCLHPERIEYVHERYNRHQLGEYTELFGIETKARVYREKKKIKEARDDVPKSI